MKWEDLNRKKKNWQEKKEKEMKDNEKKENKLNGKKSAMQLDAATKLSGAKRAIRNE